MRARQSTPLLGAWPLPPGWNVTDRFQILGPDWPTDMEHPGLALGLKPSTARCRHDPWYQDETLGGNPVEYFSFAIPSGTATCGDGECSCSKEPIPTGAGYLYVSNLAVREHRDNGGKIKTAPMLLCREAAKRRDLDLEVAAQDAAHWWATGSVALRATPRRELKFKEFLGTSVEEAVQKAREGIRGDLLGTDTVRDVRQASASAQGRTAEEALTAVTNRLPAEAFDAKPAALIQEGQSGELEITAQEESEAKREWRRRAPRGANLTSLTCANPPKNGLMGMGKKPGTWIAGWSAPYIAEVVYMMPAVVSARYFP